VLLLTTVCRKVYGALVGLGRLADVTLFAVRMRLLFAFVVPFFT
jgi:hypothetical protein